ncbi:uncharacterized protein [Montipora capricornis]|uniref:uncharacterized protein n=1 Tax=Montipora capricornis TaxID=246305 RepID=UPI0035F1B8BA
MREQTTKFEIFKKRNPRREAEEGEEETISKKIYCLLSKPPPYSGLWIVTEFASQRRRKRKFHGNRFTNSKNYNNSGFVDGESSSPLLEDEIISSNTRVDDEGKECLSASYRKLNIEEKKIEEKKPVDKSEKTSTSSSDPTITGFRLFDIEVLCNVLSLLRCHECGESSLSFMEDEIYRKGCASSLRLLCENCGWIYSFYTSKQQGKSFEVNRRIVYSMRTLGKGHTGAKKFCSLMNMPPPPAPNNYAKISKVITTCLQSIAKERMSKAAEEIRILKGQNDPPVNEPVGCGVSFDGTWQKRGFSSRNGCVTAISIDTGKVLDVEALSQACKQCELHEHLDKNSEEYRRWQADHTICKANFKGSAPAMEPEGVNRIFRRSVEQEDQAGVHLSQRKSLDNTKKRRKVLRGLKKRKDDKRKKAEGVNYASGYF